MMEDFRKSRAAFLSYMARQRPELIAAAMKRASARKIGLSAVTEVGTGATLDVTEPGYFDKVLAALKEIAPAYAQYQMARDLYSLNMERAKQGLPPIDASAVSPQINVGLSPDVKTLLILGGVGLTIMMLAARRRR